MAAKCRYKRRCKPWDVPYKQPRFFPVMIRWVVRPRLRQVSEAQSGKVLGVLNGLSSLSELASEHIKRANAIRHHLHLLALNTIIESTRLNNQGDTIHAIADCIKEVAADIRGLAALGRLPSVPERYGG